MEEFVLTENHITLLRRAYVGWQNCETGAPEIDPKRPYGNSSVAIDVLEILGIKPVCPDCGYSDAQEEEGMKIHMETETALQIILETGSFVPGRYERVSVEGWKKFWRLCK